MVKIKISADYIAQVQNLRRTIQTAEKTHYLSDEKAAYFYEALQKVMTSMTELQISEEKSNKRIKAKIKEFDTLNPNASEKEKVQFHTRLLKGVEVQKTRLIEEAQKKLAEPIKDLSGRLKQEIDKNFLKTTNL